MLHFNFTEDSAMREKASLLFDAIQGCTQLRDEDYTSLHNAACWVEVAVC